MTDTALRARSPLRIVIVPLVGIALVAIAAFAIMNVDLLERWGGSLADRFQGGMSLPLTVLAVFLAGVLTSLTPCVYPVIPLAVTYLGARTATSRLHAFSLAGVYVAGMVACYTVLGAAAGLTGTTFGSATQRWWIYAGVATVVLVFGLSMMGLFTISLPAGLQQLAGRGKGPGYRGAFLMGATSGLVTAPCTAPVLGTLIIPMISHRSVALGSILLAVFGLGMGMLFLVVGTYSGVLTSLPRSGRWMVAVKTGLGVAILAVSLFFYFKAWTMLPWRGAPRPLTSQAAAFGTLDRGGDPRLGEGRGMTGGPIPRVLLAGMSGGSHPGSAAVGAAAPDFQITDVKGRRHDLGRYRGKTLHLFFFAEWCPPCVDQLRTIELADARLRGRGYAVLAIGMKSREDEGALRTFADERTLSFPVAWDADGSAARAYGVDSIPVHVIVGPNGSIRYRGRSLPEGFDTDGAGLLPG